MSSTERFYYVISLHNNKTSGIYTRTESKEFPLGANANRALKENLQILKRRFIACNIFVIYGEIVNFFIAFFPPL